MIKLTIEVETEHDTDNLYMRERITKCIQSYLTAIPGMKEVRIRHDE